MNAAAKSALKVTMLLISIPPLTTLIEYFSA